MSEIELTDRYQALGIPYPDPETMCQGQCEGTGVYPVKRDTPDITPAEMMAWQLAHDQSPHTCDGWHFIGCPDCGGTGKRKAA